jgi:hypothetical protein
VESARVPQHLELEDVVSWGLSAADLICVVAGAVVGWWSYLALPDPLVGRVAVSVLIVLVGAALGILRIGQLPLRGWIAVAVAYALRPRVLITTGRR